MVKINKQEHKKINQETNLYIEDLGEEEIEFYFKYDKFKLSIKDNGVQRILSLRAEPINYGNSGPHYKETLNLQIELDRLQLITRDVHNNK
jgi:hypothetical protein